MFELPVAGSAAPEILQLVHETWTDAAAKSQIDLSEFNPNASLRERLNWAMRVGLLVGAILARYSSKLQHSTAAQVRENVHYAARNGIYVPPEFVCVDEAVTGRKLRRDGLDRMKLILQHKLAHVLLVFKVSRLFRVAYRGFQFFQEEIVEAGLRAISVSQGIDTADEKSWKVLAYVHGIMDEMFITTVADHVRAELGNLFQNGFVVGPLCVGYKAEEVKGGCPTNTGKPAH